MTELTREQRRDRKQRRNDLQSVLAHPPSARFLARLLHETGIGAPAFNTDPVYMGYLNGRRSIGLDLVAEIEQVDRHAFINLQISMLREREDAQRQEQQDDE